jgi:hypothetical protein
MEIDSNERVLRGSCTEELKKTRESVDKKFGDVLQKTIERSCDVRSGPQGPSMMNNIPEIRLNPFSHHEKTRIMYRIENFLDTLEEYHRKLGDPRVTLKDIHPLISDMAAKEENLISSFNSLPDGDKLKDILNRTLITSSVEIIKFNRGDYVSP